MLSEKVSQLVSGRLILKFFSNKVAVNLHMLGTFVEHMICSYMNSTQVVTI